MGEKLLMKDVCRKINRNSDNNGRKDNTGRVRVLDARDLFKESNEVRVRHCDEEYRLMLTRNNKLILTK